MAIKICVAWSRKASVDMVLAGAMVARANASHSTTIASVLRSMNSLSRMSVREIVANDRPDKEVGQHHHGQVDCNAV
jgi:hypothetical protein